MLFAIGSCGSVQHQRLLPPVTLKAYYINLYFFGVIEKFLESDYNLALNILADQRPLDTDDLASQASIGDEMSQTSIVLPVVAPLIEEGRRLVRYRRKIATFSKKFMDNCLNMFITSTMASQSTSTMKKSGGGWALTSRGGSITLNCVVREDICIVLYVCVDYFL